MENIDGKKGEEKKELLKMKLEKAKEKLFRRDLGFLIC